MIVPYPDILEKVDLVTIDPLVLGTTNESICKPRYSVLHFSE